MQPYKDRDTYIDHEMEHSAEEYGNWMGRAGLENSPILMRKFAERSYDKATRKLEQKQINVLENNVGVIIGNHNKKMNALKKQSQKGVVLGFGFMALLWGSFSVYAFLNPDHAEPWSGWMFLIASIVCIVIILWGYFFENKPV